MLSRYAPFTVVGLLVGLLLVGTISLAFSVKVEQDYVKTPVKCVVACRSPNVPGRLSSKVTCEDRSRTGDIGEYVLTAPCSVWLDIP